MNWLLDQNTHNLITHATNCNFKPTAEQQVEFDARFSSGSTNKSSILSISGTTASISVSGAITKNPDLLAYFFGGGNTTYSEIITSLIDADSSPDVNNIILDIDSPGGQFEGMFDLLAELQKTSKPIEAIISNVGASAAYAIASQADKITARNKASRVGSIGVAATVSVNQKQISISSTAAPKKRPDITTDEGKAVIREELDAMHTLFVDAIAQGRGTTVSNVNAQYGQGATLLAEQALKVGMIDGINDDASNQPIQKTGNFADKQEAKSIMDINTLKTEHAGLYLSVMAEGQAKERDRVCAHMKMGESSGDMKTATAAISEGSEMTATLQATYMCAAMNRSDIEAASADSDDASAIDGVQDDSNLTASDEVASMVESKLGLEV